jgi:hypothetical protein
MLVDKKSFEELLQVNRDMRNATQELLKEQKALRKDLNTGLSLLKMAKKVSKSTRKRG